MKIIKIEIFEFKELNDKAKLNALDQFYDININFDWWDFTYYEASQIGLSIFGFDTYRKEINGKFVEQAIETANDIKNNHWESCGTYTLAIDFLLKFEPLALKNAGLDYWDYDLNTKISDLEEEFLKDLLEEYLIILENEFEYLTSEQAIIETIEANDYYFDINGKLI